MLRTALLSAGFCAALTTPAALACTKNGDMARIAQTASGLAVSAEVKTRVRAILLRARKQQTAGELAACSLTLSRARQLLDPAG